jgi:hypothetical protein
MNWKAFLKNLVTDKDGNISTTKIGAGVAAVGTAVVGFPTAMAAAGVIVVLPVAIMTGAKVAMAVGGYIAVIGGRNAIDKVNK